MNVMKRLVGERRAVAAAVLAFYAFVYLLLLLNPLPGWERAFGAMAGVYALGFFGVVAGYFWARWYAIGVGLSGVISAVVSIWQIGPEPVLVFLGATHGAISLALWGEGVSRAFDGREEWRAKFHMDEHAVHRLGRAVIRIGISLPYILLYALAPKQGMDAVQTATAVLALGLAGTGLWGLLRLRTWGLLALAGATALLTVGAIDLMAGGGAIAVMTDGGIAPGRAVGIDLGTCALVGAALLAAALAPFARPALDFVRR